MPRSWLDHITITAPTLAIGVDYVRQTLGVAPESGGEHPEMGTHNYLMKLGETVYLEVIAINPNAPFCMRPRWFGLDDLKPESSPRLATWVARTDDIVAAVAISMVPLGGVESMTRDLFQWRMTIPSDGSLPLQGIAPTLIQWPQATHPTRTLRDVGCRLIGIEGFHPEAFRINSTLACIGFEGAFSVSPSTTK